MLHNQRSFIATVDFVDVTWRWRGSIYNYSVKNNATFVISALRPPLHDLNLFSIQGYLETAVLFWL